MRLMPLISIAFVLSISGTLFAQEWIEFASRDDRFTCNFPTQPKVTEMIYRSQHEADLPARVGRMSMPSHVALRPDSACVPVAVHSWTTSPSRT